ncbi:carboxypeptidase B-like [Pelobates cultripes]|uniref:Carboxypeptidase B-like n=1 Tax=Pelobates cultripes TaxID=61616 RepID=A0AAD1RBJ7_PELCU|nr:carboxypeptidase B-like [Pelobates cultripes]
MNPEGRFRTGLDTHTITHEKLIDLWLSAEDSDMVLKRTQPRSEICRLPPNKSNFILSLKRDKVFRVVPQNAEHVELLRSLDINAELDFWVPDSTSSIIEGARVDFRAKSHVSYDVQAFVAQSGMPYQILIEDVQLAVESQQNSNIRAVHSYLKYNEIDTINAWTASIAAEYPDLVSRSLFATSYESRPVYLLKVGKSGNNKKAIFIDCGFHAREWITPAFCQWFVKEAVNSYGTDAQFTKLLDNLDFYVVPVLNVDGYAYSWTTDRLWRKTRSINKNEKCVGTDPNRNFNAGWCTETHIVKRIYLAKQAVKTYGKDKEMTKLVNSVTFHVLPVYNIDGYVWSWTHNRMWRKNRSPVPDSNCFGADLNRNFNVSWCDIGSSDNPCSNMYCGPSPESEKETQNVANFIRGHLDSIKAYISIHSYSQLLLYPFAYTFDLAPNAKELDSISKAAVSKLSKLYGTQYTYGQTASTLYRTSGSSSDWAYTQGVKYSFTFELRDEGKYGFLLPEAQIEPTCKETTRAVKYMVKYILQHS